MTKPSLVLALLVVSLLGCASHTTTTNVPTADGDDRGMRTEHPSKR